MRGLYKIGTVKKVTDVLDRAGKPYALYTGVKPNPTVSLVNEAKAVYDREGCDYLIGIGGGSPLDVSKAISILAKTAVISKITMDLTNQRNPVFR